MVGEISTATRIEVLGAIGSRYREAAKRDKSRMLDEFVAIVGCHRKHAVRLLAHCEEGADRALPRGRRIYDEAVRQALIVVWEASDRICGKRLKAALPAWYGHWRNTGIWTSTRTCESGCSLRALPR